MPKHSLLDIMSSCSNGYVIKTKASNWGPSLNGMVYRTTVINKLTKGKPFTIEKCNDRKMAMKQHEKWVVWANVQQ